MSSLQPCMKFIFDVLRNNPEIPCNCAISILRRHPELVLCDCIVCQYENSDCDCEECQFKKTSREVPESTISQAIKREPVEAIDVEYDFVDPEFGRHQSTGPEAIETVSNDSFYSMQIFEDELPVSKFQGPRCVFSCICATFANATTSWKFWCALFLLTLVLGIGSILFILASPDTDVVHTTISSSVDTTTNAISTSINSSTSTILTTTVDDFPTPI